MKKRFILIIIILVLIIAGCDKKNTNDITIMTTNFPSYDFARAITKNSNIKVKMLVKPGSETHDFDPTPKDIVNIENSKMFIYVGGESDEWVNTILKDIDVNSIKLMDLVEVVEEEIVDGMEHKEEHEHEEEYDEHVWTSPINAITILNKLKDEIVKLDPTSRNLFESNTKEYIDKIEAIDKEIREIINNSKRKELVFADRFPLRYFVLEYGLEYSAAFPGCSEQTEASSKTISYLINKVKKDNIPVVFHIEMSNGNIAKTIANETGAKVLEFNSAHNISLDDFNNSITYVDIMKNNVEVLKEALN